MDARAADTSEPTTQTHLALLPHAAEIIANAKGLLITADAGMGVDSGLPDFRGPEGFWRAYPAYRRLGLVFANLASPRHFRHDPALAWGFNGHRLHLYRDTYRLPFIWPGSFRWCPRLTVHPVQKSEVTSSASPHFFARISATAL